MTNNLKHINEAWLNLDITSDDEIFNPLSILNSMDDDYHLKLTWLMTRPEYFSFLCKHILNVQILPSQALMLCEMWNRKFPMLIATRGFGKSFILSLYAILRALILPKRKIVIVGAAFRQSKVLFEYMETIWGNSPLLRDICDNESGPRRDVDRCVLRLNDSRITALPLGDGQKIRGQRANDIISDEFACLEAGSLVETTNGLIRIEDFNSAKTSSIVTGDNKLEFEFPCKFIKTPPTAVYEIKLSNGYVIRCSENHQVMTNNGWKKPLELTNKDWIEKSKSIIFGSNTDGLTRDLCWLIGLLISEGSITDKKRISISTTDVNLVNRIVDKFNWKVSVKQAYTDNRYGWKCKESYTVYTDDEILRKTLFDLGLDYVKSHDKVIPKSILRAPKGYVLSFLSGLFEGDGSCFLWKDRDIENRIGLAYYSVSERLCRDVQILMNGLGYDGYINKRKSKISNNEQWFVRWNNIDAKLAAIQLNIPRFSYTIKECSIPDEPSNITWDKSRNKWKVQIKYLGKTIQKRFLNKEDAECYICSIVSDKQYRKIVSIKKLDKIDSLYDYYLPITNSFYAEGHRQHNSIPRDIFETVVAGFAAVSSDPIENVKRIASEKRARSLGVETEDKEDHIIDNKDNQIILSGTASYDFNHFANYWKKWKSIIKSKGERNKLREIFNGDDPPATFDWREYSIIRIPYELLPEGFMDAAQVARSKATVHNGIYQMEFGACFTRDSQGFFKRSLIESCVCSDTEPIKDTDGNEIRFEAKLMGDYEKKYIFGVDPASEVDNFSIVVIEANKDHRRIVHCWTTNRSEHMEKIKKGFATETDFYAYCARKIRDLMRLFPCVHIAMDAQGGGIAVMESLHDKDKLAHGEIPIWPTIDRNKQKPSDNERGLHILEMCQFAKYEWLSEANHGLRKDFEDKILLFPAFDSVSLGISNAEDAIKGRIYDTLENCVMEIEQLKDELSMIQMSQTPNGRDRWDTPEVIIGAGKKSKMRKDRYSALLMANMAGRVLSKMPEQREYEFYGGFAYTPDNSKEKEKSIDDFVGPSWFTENMKDVY